MSYARLPTRRFAVLLLVPLLLAACGQREEAGPEAVATGPREITVTDGVSGGSTGLEVGHILKVELEANPTTGYEWRFVEVGPDVLKTSGMQEFLPPDDDAPPGTPGTSIWRFEAVGPGTTTLKLEYARPFEVDAPPAKTFTFTVAVGSP